MTTVYYSGNDAKNRLKIQLRSEKGGKHDGIHCHMITTKGTATIALDTLRIY